MSSYEVGSIVYLLNKESLKIIPSIVKEEITKKTINNINTHYILELPDKSSVDIVDIKESIFKDIPSLKEFMLENTRKSVERLINNAIEVEHSIFGKKNSNEIKIDTLRVQNDIKSVIMDNDNIDNTKNLEE